MKVTEQEARTRWCPFSRTLISMQNNEVSVVGAAINRYAPPDGSERIIGLCVGSQCMLWSWVDPANNLTNEGAARLQRGEFPAPGSVEPNKSRRGYCSMGRTG